VDSEQLRLGRMRAGLTQVRAAARLRVSQPYLSQLERGRRPVTVRLARTAAKLYRLPPTTLPVPPEPMRVLTNADRLTRQLAALGYPGYRHLRPSPPVNPARLVLDAVSQDNLDARVTEALPWVLLQFPDLDWDWLVSNTKLRNLQNRLGFLVGLAAEVAGCLAEQPAAEARLREVEQQFERARLAAETTLGREAMPAAERVWLRANRPPGARHWNVLTSLTAEGLLHAA
jgi:transcriptional regulator with XRE-family HTH domain